MSSSDQIKDLIRTGKKDGYILEDNLEKSISHMPDVDQTYIRNTIEGFKIQIIKSQKDYDELKYLSGADAIEFLQNLSEANTVLLKKIKIILMLLLRILVHQKLRTRHQLKVILLNQKIMQ